MPAKSKPKKKESKKPEKKPAKKQGKKLGLIKRLFSGCLMFLGVIFILLLAFLILAYYSLSRSPELAKGMRAVTLSEAAAQDFDAKYQAFRAAFEQSHPGDALELTLSEAEVSSKLNKMVQEGKVPTDIPLEAKGEVQVNFSEGKALASAETSIYGIPAKIALKAKIAISPDGWLMVEVEEIDLGRAPVPGNIQQRIKDFAVRISGELNINDLAVTWQSIQLQDGLLVLSGTP